ncbi:MAG TPA: helix-turn-helix transcriptional regulator [Acidimicrobiia bacterium]|nr:helix-turn-helix transcriptional regulator [Acidimicrobiia bacterium]
MLELAILGFLKEETLHGYELKKRLDEMVGALSGVSYGSLYPALRRLEKAGAIEAVETEVAPAPIPATGSIGGETAAARMRRRLSPTRRRRKEYRITEHGNEMLRDLLEEEAGAADDRGFALRLAFCRYLDPEARLRLFERRRASLAERLARVRSALSPKSERRRLDLYTRSLMEHDDEATRRDLQWVEELIAAEQGEAPERPERPENHENHENHRVMSNEGGHQQ